MPNGLSLLSKMKMKSFNYINPEPQHMPYTKIELCKIELKKDDIIAKDGPYYT
jgi:hypothetical protein